MIRRPRGLAVIAVLPPPLTGMTLVSRHVANIASELDHVETLCFSRPKSLRSHRLWSVYKHLRLIGTTVLGIARGNRALYVVVDSGGGLLGTAAIAALCRLTGTSLLLHHHVYRYIREQDWRMQALLRIGGKRLHHLFLANVMADEFVRTYGCIEHTVMTNAAAAMPPGLSTGVSTDATEPREIRIGYLGRIEPAKGFEHLRALPKALGSCRRDVRLLLAGPCSDPDIVRQLAEMNKDESVEVLGGLYDDDKYNFLGSLDALLLPTEYANEAQPMVIWEAASVGTPTIAFDRGAIRALVTELGGLAVDPNSDFTSHVIEFVDSVVTSRDQRQERQSRVRTAAQTADETLRDLLSTAKAMGT